MSEEDIHMFDEEVPTSDPEEAEAIRAEQPGYWATPMLELSPNRLLLLGRTRPLEETRSYPLVGGSGSMRDDSGEGVSHPRKRIRMSHSLESSPERRRSIEKLFRDVGYSSTQPLSSTKPSFADQSKVTFQPSLSGISPSTQMTQSLPTPTPTLDEPSSFPRTSSPFADVPIKEEDDITMDARSQCSPIDIPSSDPEEVELETTVPPPPVAQHLFTPPQSQESARLNSPRRLSIPPQNRRDSSLEMLSPLSSAQSSEHGSPPPNASNPAVSENPVAPGYTIEESDPPVEQQHQEQMEHDQQAGRYRLRERQARQIKPYQYDAKLYERQLRGNPDAIVRMRLHGDRQHVRSKEDAAGSSDQEVEPSQFEPEESDGERPRRRRSESAKVLDGPRQPDAAGPSVAPAVQADTWHPAAFDIEFSDDDDDDDLPLGPPHNDIDSEAEKAKQQSHRRKRFPMLKRGLQKQKTRSPSVHSDPHEDSPVRRSISKTISYRRIDSSDDEMPAAGSQRKLKSRSSSRQIEPDGWEVRPTDPMDDHLSADEIPPTSPRASSSSMDGLDEYNQHRAIEDDWMGQDDNLSPRLLRNVRETARHWPHGEQAEEGASQTAPIEISDDEVLDVDPDEEGASDTESDSEPDVRNAKGMKLLSHMYPKAWIEKEMQKEAQRKAMAKRRKAHREVSGPMKPGEVRVRRRSTPLNNAEIRGDSESEEEPPIEDRPALDLFVAANPRRSPDPVVPRRSLSTALSRRSISSTVSQRYASPAVPEWSQASSALRRAYNSPTPDFNPVHHLPNEVEDHILTSESEDDDLSDAADDEALEQWNERGLNMKTKSGAERNPIDYMLSRTCAKKRKRTTGRKLVRKPGGRQHRQSSGVARVMTGGVRGTGHERQTLLTISRPRGERSRQANVVAQHDEMSDDELAPQISYHRPGEEGQKEFVHDLTLVQKTSKQKDRKRNKPSVYTFSSTGQMISSGRPHAQARTVQAEVEWSPPPNRSAVKPPSRVGLPAMPLARKHQLREPVRTHTAITDYFPALNEPQDRLRSLTPVDGEPLGAELPPTVGRQSLEWTPVPAAQIEDELPMFYTPKLQSGIAFPPNSDLTEGRLLALITSAADNAVPDPPRNVYFKQASLDPNMPIASFIDILTTALSDLIETLSHDTMEISMHDYEDWHRSFKNLGPYITWYLSRGSPDYQKALDDFAIDIVSKIYNVVDGYHAVRSDGGYVNLLVLDLQWYAVETIFRVRREHPIDLKAKQADPTSAAAHLILLVTHLSVFDASDPQSAVQTSIEGPPLRRRIGELWVSLIHLTQEWEQLQQVGCLWDILLEAIPDSDASGPGQDLYTASEYMWRTIFSLCAWSQFSRSGITTRKTSLPTRWKMVVSALRRVDLLKHVPHKQQRAWYCYIRLLISRCLHLHREWQWDFGDPLDPEVLKIVREFLGFFKARAFSNVSGDKTDYPEFLKTNNFENFDEHKGNVYTLYIKFVMEVAKGKAPAQVKKLLSITAPVGSVTFSKSSHGMLSSVLNRFTFAAVAVYIAPDDCKNMIARVRRYVDIAGIRHVVCRGLIRGIRHIGEALRQNDCPLQGVVDWLDDVVVEQIKQYIERGHSTKILTCIQMVFDCLRKIITVRPWKSAWYPDPALLAGGSIARVCGPDIKLAGFDGGASILQGLIMAFLNVKDKTLPSRLTLAAQNQESQESQDDYGSFDFDDPDLLAALDDHDVESQSRRERDQEVVTRLLSDVMPIVERMLCEGVAAAKIKQSPSLKGWVQCWAACASAIVRNGQKPWSFYVRTAELFWEDASPRLQIALRVMLRLTALQHNASVYEADKLEFLRLMLQSMVIPSVAFAPEYVACVLWNDGLRHPILTGISYEAAQGREIFELSELELNNGRAAMIEGIAGNISDSIDKQASEGGRDLAAANETYVGLLCSMLTAMKTCLPHVSGNAEYLDFWRHIYQALSSSHELKRYPNVQTLITWLQSALPQAAA